MKSQVHNPITYVYMYIASYVYPGSHITSVLSMLYLEFMVSVSSVRYCYWRAVIELGEKRFFDKY